jgi:enoyl-CoA hydratase/carnithine racemase
VDVGPQTEFAHLLLDRDAGVATLTLNRPEARNALNPQIFGELAQALDQLDDDDDVRVIILTGAGDHFCVGADLSSGSSVLGREGYATFEKQTAHLRNRDLMPWKLVTPTIGALNGTAVGAGITLALQLDIVIIAEDAKVGFPFVRRGLTPERNALWGLPRLVGTQRALELMLTGRIFSGREAVEMGLGIEALPRAQVLPRARELASEIARHAGPVASAATKLLTYRGLEQPDREAAFELEREVFQTLGEGEECQEGVNAFLEKRSPIWRQSKKRDLPPGLR